MKDYCAVILTAGKELAIVKQNILGFFPAVRMTHDVFRRVPCGINYSFLIFNY